MKAAPSRAEFAISKGMGFQLSMKGPRIRRQRVTIARTQRQRVRSLACFLRWKGANLGLRFLV